MNGDEEDIPALKPYAEEAQKVLSESQPGEPDQGEVRRESLSSVWEELNRCTNAIQAMHVILTATQQLTNCDAAVIHIRQGREVKKIEFIGELPRHLPTTLPWHDRHWILRTIQSQQRVVVQNVQDLPPDSLKETEAWSATARELFLRVRSFAVFPMAADETFGALSVVSSQRNHFTLARRQTLQSLAGVAATAWMDLRRAQTREAIVRQEMASATVHNLRQPTMAIRGALQRILKLHEKGTLTAEYAVEATRDALKYLKRNEDIINDVLRSIKPLMLRMSTRDLRALLEPITNEFIKSHEYIKVETNIPVGMTIQADIESLRQVLEELFLNASRALKDCGTIKVYASSAQISNDLGQTLPAVQVAVEDDGLGVPSNFTNKLFEPFVTNSAQGTGLGLAFAKSVIEEHGGRIWHESVNPHGTRFAFVLPAVTEENTNDE